MTIVNKREHYRVIINFPVQWRELNKKESDMVRQGLGDRLLRHEGLPNPIDEFLAQVSPGSKEEQMFRSMQLLNNKLDFIIENLLPSSVQASLSLDYVVELSASGLKFTTKEKVNIGVFLIMYLIMPGTIQYQIDLITEVMRVDVKDDEYSIATRVVNIDDAARDSIIKTVFQRQRMDIRRLKANKKDNDND